jgi:Na+(H+)/acetate symporter ActP
MTVLLGAAANGKNVAFLARFTPFEITMMCLVPALLFTIYVFWDDARQARAHKQEASKGGAPTH